MTLTRWQLPHNWALSQLRRGTLRDEVDQLFDFAFEGLGGSRKLANAWSPALDLYEDKDNVTVQVELPGLKKEDINIQLEDGFLKISGERKTERKDQEGGVYRSERYVGRFERTVSLSSEVDAEKIKASYADGILTVTLPKSEKAKPKQIPVTID